MANKELTWSIYVVISSGHRDRFILTGLNKKFSFCKLLFLLFARGKKNLCFLTHKFDFAYINYINFIWKNSLNYFHIYCLFLQSQPKKCLAVQKQLSAVMKKIFCNRKLRQNLWQHQPCARCSCVRQDLQIIQEVRQLLTFIGDNSSVKGHILKLRSSLSFRMKDRLVRLFIFSFRFLMLSRHKCI